MNTPLITLPEVISRLSRATKCEQATADDFMLQLIASVTELLKTRNEVDVEPLGKFIKEFNRITFQPSKSLTELVNAPFELFKPVELSPEYKEDDEASTPPSEELPPLPQLPPVVILDNKDNDTRDEQDDSDVPDSDVDTNDEARDEEEIIEQVPINTVKEASDSSNETTTINYELTPDNDTTPMEQEYYEEPKKSKSSCAFWLGLIIGLLIGFMAGFVLRPVIMKGLNSQTGTEAEKVENSQNNTDATAGITSGTVAGNTAKTAVSSDIADSNTPVSTEVTEDSQNGSAGAPEVQSETPNEANKIVTDTIRPGRFLTTLSRKYYGNRPEFWIYIYEENKRKIIDPQNVPVGTVLVIPDAAKYGINPNSRESISIAKEKIRLYEKSKEQ